MTTETQMSDGATTTDAAASQPAGATGTQAAADAGTTTQTQQTTADTTAAEAKPGDAKPADAPKTGAPEKYEAFKVADGALSADDIAKVETLARELNLSQEGAQKLAEIRAADKADSAKAQAQALTDARAAWVTQTKDDKELGGEKLAENLAVAKKGLQALDPDGAVQKLLEVTGFGDHPEVIRMFHRAGKAMSEDSLVLNGKAPAGAAKSIAQRLFPNMNA
jgi:hypothetical protein